MGALVLFVTLIAALLLFSTALFGFSRCECNAVAILPSLTLLQV